MPRGGRGHVGGPHHQSRCDGVEVWDAGPLFGQRHALAERAKKVLCRKEDGGMPLDLTIKAGATGLMVRGLDCVVNNDIAILTWPRGCSAARVMLRAASLQGRAGPSSCRTCCQVWLTGSRGEGYIVLQGHVRRVSLHSPSASTDLRRPLDKR